jgi:hypothetical protein
MTDALTLGLLIMLVAVAGIGGTWVAVKVRRWSRHEQPREPFTLQQLREMRARHEIDDQEFQALRSELLSRIAVEHSPGDRPKSSRI